MKILHTLSFEVFLRKCSWRGKRVWVLTAEELKDPEAIVREKRNKI